MLKNIFKKIKKTVDKIEKEWYIIDTRNNNKKHQQYIDNLISCRLDTFPVKFA